MYLHQLQLHKEEGHFTGHFSSVRLTVVFIFKQRFSFLFDILALTETPLITPQLSFYQPVR